MIAVVEFAREQGLRIAPQATGHNAGPLGSLDGTILLNTSELTGVSIDAAARRVRVAATIKWEAVTPQLSELGLAALHVSSPDVGIVGYSLGGGVGWLARKHGLQANSVTAVELVTADGHLVRTDPNHEPDLFWAAAGTSAWSLRSSSPSTPSRSSTQGRCSSRSSPRPRSFKPGAGCCPRSWTRSPRGRPWSSSRTSRRPPSRCAAARSRSFPRRSSAARPMGASCCVRCASSGRPWTRSGCTRPWPSPSWRWTRRTRCPTGARDIAQSLYVTPKTVGVHLTNGYRKLGIRSRRELPDALAS